MSDNRLPPLRLNSAMSTNSNGSNDMTGSNTSLNSRERRRQKLKEQMTSKEENSDLKTYPTGEDSTNRKKNRRGKALSQTDNSNTNLGYEIDETDKAKDSEERVTNRPPVSSRRGAGAKKKSQRNNFKVQALSNNFMLQGLEEDIIEMDEEETVKNSKENVNASDRRGSDSSMKDLGENNLLKSVPTDKFYLELEKKFAVQNKELFEKKEQERLRQEFDWHLKQKQKEEQKFQISTPKTALNTHRLLRKIFLFIQGINVGFQFWQIIVIFFNSSSQFEYKQNQGYVNNITGIKPLFLFFEKLTLPIHSISYFFLTICIIDTIDRVDFTKMNCDYFVKCISFQNQFWSIIFYSVSLVVSLSLIFVDESVYLLQHLRNDINASNKTNDLFTSTINSNSDVWQYLSIVRVLFCVLGWLLFSIFMTSDETYNSLKNRDFSLIDDLMVDSDSKSAQKQRNSVQLSQKTNPNV